MWRTSPGKHVSLALPKRMNFAYSVAIILVGGCFPLSNRSIPVAQFYFHSGIPLPILFYFTTIHGQGRRWYMQLRRSHIH